MKVLLWYKVENIVIKEEIRQPFPTYRHFLMPLQQTSFEINVARGTQSFKFVTFSSAEILPQPETLNKMLTDRQTDGHSQFIDRNY